MRGLECDLRHRFPSGFVLEAAFTAGPGVTAVFGPSGSGKSTILTMLAGTLRPGRGRFVLGERTLLDTDRGIFVPAERRGIGVVFQGLLLFPHMTVQQNLRFGQHRSRRRTVPFERVVEVLGLEAFLDRYPGSLSGGQQQRVALGRALLSGSELLMLDEPLAALDADLKDRILAYLGPVLAEWRIPTLFVSHDQTDVRRFADQVVLIEAGRVRWSGPTAEIWEQAVRDRPSGDLVTANLIQLGQVEEQEGHLQASLGQGQCLHLPAMARSFLGRPALVRFLARDVMLARSALSGLSARNQLSGQVRRLVLLGDRALVAIDIGQMIWSELTPDAVRQLELAEGQSITCIIKASALEVIG